MVKNSRIMFKMTLREIKSNIKQYLALILISFLAMTLFIGLNANSLTLKKRVDTLYEQGNIADIFVYVNSTNEIDKTYLKNIEGVESVEERIYLSTSIDGYNGTLLIASKDNKISTYSSLKDNSKSGFLIDKHFHELYKKNIGDELHFDLNISLNETYISFKNLFMKENNLDEETFNIENVKEGKTPFLEEKITLREKITGIMEHPEASEVSSSNVLTVLYEEEMIRENIYSYYSYLIDDCFKEGIFKNLLNNYLNNFSLNAYKNQYLIKACSGASLKDINAKINDYFANVQNSKLITSLTKDNIPSTITLESDVKQAKQLTIVFPFIFFVVAILVVLTSLSQLIFRSRRDIGILKAIGVSKFKILFHYISFGVILTFIGCLLGSIVGPILIPKIMDNKYSIIYILPSVKTVFPYLNVILCTIIFCSLSGLVSYLVSYKEVNLNPVESTRPKRIKELKTLKSSKKEKMTPLFLSLRMTIRNIIHNFSRSIMVILGVMGCTALLISGFGIMDTVNYGINLDFDIHDKSDINITYSMKKSEKNTIESIDNIDIFSEYMTLPLKVQNEDKIIETTLQVFDNEESTYDFVSSINEGVALPFSLAKKLNVKLNDNLVFIYKGEKLSLKIDYLFESSYLLKIYTKANNFILENFVPSGANITLKNKDEINNTIEEIESLDLSLATLTIHSENKNRIKEILSSVEIMCNTVKIFAIMLSIVVTYNLALMNFNERKRDIATLKVIGCNNKEIMLSLISEIMLLTFIGCIFGVFLGYPLLVLILKVNQIEIFHFLYHIFTSSYIFSIIISFGSSIIVNIILGILSNKVDAVSALKSVE